MLTVRSYIEKHVRVLMHVFLVLGLLTITPTLAQAEVIESFIAEIEVRKDATFTVTEEIVYTFTEPRHGIFRYIPTLHQEQPSSFLRERYIDIDVESVTMDGEEAPFTEEGSGDEFYLKIGDANVEIEGTHVYEISYTVGGGLSYEENGGAELYWNVTGNDWTIPILYAEARLTSPDGILTSARACYRGFVGESGSCESVSEEGGVVRMSGSRFRPGEGLTVAQAVNRAVVVSDIRERYKPLLLWGFLILAGLIIGGVSLYRYKTKFKTGRTIIPQYEPYPGVKPMYAGFLFDKRLDPRDITAGIVYLAEQGFIKIKKIDAKVLFFFEVDDYELTLLRSSSELEGTFERELVTLIFGGSSIAKLLNFNTVKKYILGASKNTTTPPEALAKEFVESASEDVAIGKKVTLRELKDNHAQARENSILIQNLKSDLLEDLQEKDFFTKVNVFKIFVTVFGITFLAFAGSIVLSSLAPSFTPLVFISIPAGIVALVFLAGGRRTQKGYEALDHLKGFKDFLSVTDKDRFIFHNAPEKNAEQFMEYLPYAIAFGVEKQWAKTFEGITVPNPDWYDSGSGVTSFNAGSLTQSLGAFSTAFASTSASGSASSGGGSSGGGGGGGGGGSW